MILLSILTNLSASFVTDYESPNSTGDDSPLVDEFAALVVLNGFDILPEIPKEYYGFARLKQPLLGPDINLSRK
jgi:hypothetical protein